MRVVHRTVGRRSIIDKTIYAREPQLIKLPIPVPSIPILAPIIAPIVGGSNKNTNPGTTTPANTPRPAQTTSPSSPSSSPPPSSGGGTSNGGGTNNGGGTSPPSGGSPGSGGDGSSVPVPPVVVPGSGTGSSDTPPSGSPITGSDAIPSGVTSGASPTSGSLLEGGGGGVTPTVGSDNLAANDPSGSVHGGVANPGGTPQGGLSKNSGGTYTVGAGDSSSSSTATSNDPSNPTAASSASKGHISTGAIAAIVVVFITIFFALLIIFLRRRSRARRDEQAITWWFSRKRTSQTYGDRNSAEILAAGSRSARSSFATTVDHSFTLPTEVPTIPPLPPMAEIGRVNTSPLQLSIEPSRYNTEVPDKRFSIGSNHSENSQYLFVNLRNSLQLTPLTGQAFSPSQAFAFPKPPSPVGDRASAYSRPSSHHGTGTATMKSPHSDGSSFPSLPAVPPTPSAEPLIRNDPVVSDPFGDNNPFEDPQNALAPVIAPTAFAEKEIIRRPFQRTLQDELTVNVGEHIRILMTFDDGWAYVVKVPTPGSGGGDKDDASAADNKGLIPIDCLRGPGQDLPAFIASKRVSSYSERDAISAI